MKKFLKKISGCGLKKHTNQTNVFTDRKSCLSPLQCTVTQMEYIVRLYSQIPNRDHYLYREEL